MERHVYILGRSATIFFPLTTSPWDFQAFSARESLTLYVLGRLSSTYSSLVPCLDVITLWLWHFGPAFAAATMTTTPQPPSIPFNNEDAFKELTRIIKDGFKSLERRISQLEHADSDSKSK